MFDRFFCNDYCIVPENTHIPPTVGIGNSWGVGGSQRPINLIKCMKRDWNFRFGGGGMGARKNPFYGGGMDNFWCHTFGLVGALKNWGKFHSIQNYSLDLWIE